MDIFEGLKLVLMLCGLVLLIRQELDRYNTWRIHALFTANPANAAQVELPKFVPEAIVFVDAETGQKLFSLLADTATDHQVLPPVRKRH